MQKYACGCRRIITSQENRRVSLLAERTRNTTPSRIAADLAIATGTHDSARTISIRLNQVCLYARKPVRCILF